MKEILNYQSVPFNYVHCFHRECPRAKECLRHLVALNAPQSVTYIHTLNPAAYPKNPDRCPHFKPSAKVRLAWGLTGFYDNIPYRTAIALRRAIRAIYPKTTYYRLLNSERAISPKEQEKIAEIFVQFGITTPPTYDSYTEDYNWEE